MNFGLNVNLATIHSSPPLILLVLHWLSGTVSITLFLLLCRTLPTYYQRLQAHFLFRHLKSAPVGCRLHSQRPTVLRRSSFRATAVGMTDSRQPTSSPALALNYFIEDQQRLQSQLGDDDDFLRSLALPDPFASNMPPSPHDHARAAPRTTEIIDLTTTPPARDIFTAGPEIIDLDNIPDERPNYLSNRRMLRRSDAEEHLARSEGAQLSAAGWNASASSSSGHDSGRDPQRDRRRQWLLATADLRARQRRDRELGERQESDARRTSQASSTHLSSLLTAHNMLGEGMARLTATARAFVHGPNGGGPVHGQIPHRFLQGGGLALLPQMAHYHETYGLAMGMSMPTSVELPPMKYVPPEPCKEPFTRTFTESDILVCPGCMAELGGVGDETKRKIFLSKCGHVYCGGCGHEIKNAAKKQGILCHAAGCGKKITKTKIWEAYV